MVGNDAVNKIDLLGLAPINYETKIVGKSFINGYSPAWRHPVHGGQWDGAISIEAFAVASDLIPVIDDGNPMDDVDDGEYRLFMQHNITYCCKDDGTLVDELDKFFEKGGIEGYLLERHWTGLWFPKSFSGTIDQDSSFIRVNDSTVTLEWKLWGQPNDLVEPAFTVAGGARVSKKIWQSGKVTIWCEGNKAYHRLDRFTGSRFPSHKVWINGALEAEKKQEYVSDLWVSDPGDPTFVK
jgi:hypothetical protein